MANKYIDHLTIAEYKDISNLIGAKVEELKQEVTPNEKTQTNTNYIKFKFLKMKIDQIIKKYEKNAQNT